MAPIFKGELKIHVLLAVSKSESYHKNTAGYQVTGQMSISTWFRLFRVEYCHHCRLVLQS